MDFLHRTWAEIDTSALKHNLKILKQKAYGNKIMAVVKANGYGHSDSIIAPILDECGADYFAVSNIEEALSLRENGIKKPILILGYTPIDSVGILNEKNISQCIYSKDYAKMLSENAIKENLKIKVHIKLDTGMARLGFNCRSDELLGLDDAIESARLEGFEVEGVFTHFAVSDGESEEDKIFTAEQYSRFIKSAEALKQNGINPKLIHCCNSAGFLRGAEKHLSLSRIGISLYGLAPTPKFQGDLIPVMTLKSVVSMVKEINTGDTVSYGRTFKADKPMRIATISAGYADGYPRLLSNKAYVLINGKKANILGRVCMDQMCVDVSDIPETKIGDEVILFGKNLPVDILAELTGTINYEIVCGISPRVPRIVK